jgi:hypothetical protein
MKRFTWLIIALLFVPFVAFNPSRDEFIAFLEGRFQEGEEDENALRKFGRRVVGEVSKPRISDTARREDFFLFSIFEANVFGRELRYLGILGFFIALPVSD